MKTIKYSRNINRIGVEFEGLIQRDKQAAFDRLCTSGVLDMTGDGSVRAGDLIDDYMAVEMRTPPLGSAALNKVLSTMEALEKEKAYRLNKTTGLHFHISIRRLGYGAICTPEFYSDIVAMFKKHHPKVYEARKDNGYCSDGFSERYTTEEAFKKNHFTRQSERTGSRYLAVNYSYEEHGTFEVRLYGGEYATIAGLADAIQRTIKIVDKHIKARKSIRDAVDADTATTKRESAYSVQKTGPSIIEVPEQIITGGTQKKRVRIKSITTKQDTKTIDISIIPQYQKTSKQDFDVWRPVIPQEFHAIISS